MPALPSPRLLMGVFAKAENFGRIADTPFGVDYQLQELAVAVSFFGHHVYFGYQQAVLVLANESQVSFADASHPANLELLNKIYAIDQQFGLHYQQAANPPADQTINAPSNPANK